ncbi:MAG: protein-L-isoaspartate(D-aspartate) O-methyltransferase [Thermodesulfovibrionales bacterium]|nr:protein-L-isoaspartate(D-aspartate) O-methyltransferase [Thermodesulfovibrionales bacterium]MDP3112956.1 protein-L-isoaspartate(D-aspartate) O-methyltransferase [Thermodesulfovibrionales bacterium]
MDFKELREYMVDTQLIPRGIKDERVLNAMRKVPRHLFVDGDLQYKAYDDMALPIGEDQTISQPYMVAIMTELLQLKGDEKVLEIGAGSGYQAAVLAELSRSVFTIERKAVLAKKAEERIHALGYANIKVRVGDGTLGWPEESPFDRIIITAGSPQLPQPLIEQLSDGGIIVAPVGDRFSQQLMVIKKLRGVLSEQLHTPCIFVPLIGEYGWGEEEK